MRHFCNKSAYMQLFCDIYCVDVLPEHAQDHKNPGAIRRFPQMPGDPRDYCSLSMPCITKIHTNMAKEAYLVSSLFAFAVFFPSLFKATDSVCQTHLEAY